MNDSDREIAQDKTNLDIVRSLGRLEGTIGSLEKGISMTLKKLDDHDKRISENEEALNGIKVKIGLAGAFIGAVFSALGNWVWAKLAGR